MPSPLHSKPSQPVSSASLSQVLFNHTQQRVLGCLFGQPQRSFYASELIALTHGGSGAVQRELARLAESGLVTVRAVGKQKHYQANPESPIFEELCSIVRKTMGLAEPVRAALQPVAARIDAAFIYGSVAKQQDTASSDIDLMVLSEDLSYGDLFSQLEELGQQLGRSVNPTIYAMAEWQQRLARGDSFASRVWQQPKIWLIGDESTLT